MQYFYSLGVGGKGMIPSRDHDRFGIGAYYTTVENPTLQVPLRGTRSFLSDEWGFEAFYNVALTPWMLLTPDIQVIGPSQKRRIVQGSTIGTETIGTATVLGVRLQLLL
jgi:porin